MALSRTLDMRGPPAMHVAPDRDERRRKAEAQAEYKAVLEEQIRSRHEGEDVEIDDSDIKVPEIHAPTPEDLFGLLKLCGSGDKVIAYLANLWEISPVTIGPTVKGWLNNLPEVPPPSRQRSAPPLLNPAEAALRARLAAANVSHRQRGKMGPPEVMRVDPPPSAPVRSTREDVIAAMRGLDTRLNNSTQAKRYNLLHAPSQPQRANLRVGFQAVPEDDVLNLAPAAVHELHRQAGKYGLAGAPMVDDAAAAYVMRHALVHGQGKLAPTGAGSGTKAGSVNSTWMTRAVKPLF